jgi:predicted ATPase
LASFERAREDSTPVVVSVSGPPGIGKSRLRREVLARLSGNTRVILQRSDAYGQGHALGAAADVVRGIIGLSKGATTDEARAALDARLINREEIDDAARDLIAAMLANQPLPEGSDPRGARDLLWLAMTELVVGVVRADATILVLEDTQWADPESVEFIDHLLGRASGLPLMVLLLVRPEFWQNTERLAGRDHTRVELRPLSRQAAEAIARALLGGRLDDAAVERIAQQSAGLPLFAEELARLAASGRDTTKAPTIEAAIQVSMDALSEQSRDALGRLSVFGTSCWDAGLEALGIDDAESLMRDLAGAEVLVEQAASRFTEAHEWVFKHALVREVAYDSLGEQERKELHALAADWLTSMGEDAATVAGHYDRGGQHEKAAVHWERAAQPLIDSRASGGRCT